MNTKTLITIIIVAIIAYYLLKKANSPSEVIEVGNTRAPEANTNLKFAQSITGNVEVVEVDKVTEDYNNAINEYKRLSNGYAPPAGLSTKQILALCDDMKAKAQALADYVAIAGMDDLQDEEMTLEQIQNEVEIARAEKVNTVVTLINGIGTVTLASSSAIQTARANYDILSTELKNQINNYPILTAAESTLKKLQQEKAVADATATKLALERDRWVQKKAKIHPIVSAFKLTVEDNGSALVQKAWDTNTLQALLALTKAEKVYANQYFSSVLKGATVSKNYGGTKYTAKSIYLAIPDGNTTSWRAGNAIAVQVRNAFHSISGTVDEYGNII